MRILLTGGRAPVTLELARLFHQEGHVVITAESIRYHISAPSRAVFRNYLVPAPRTASEQFVQSLIQIITQELIDLLIPTCEEIFWIARYHDRLSKICAVFCPPLTSLRPLHNKWEFIQRATTYGLKAPKTTLLTSVTQMESLRPPLVLKPVFSRFSSKTRFIQPGNPFPPIHPTLQAPWIAQQFLYGQQFCTYSVAREGRLLAHTCYPTPFTAGQGATIHFRHIHHPQALQWVNTFIQQENFSGQIAFDFIQTDSGGLYAIECNPRATSGIHLLASNPKFIQAFCQSNKIDLVTPMPDKEAMLSTAMLIYGLPAALSNRTISLWWAAFSHARDVIFSNRDPLPALWQFLTLATFISRGLRNHISPLEASTLDIEWNGE